MTPRAPRAMGGHHSADAATHEWLTPPEIIAALGGAESFDLDPCSPISRPWPTARRHFTIADNGLLQCWGSGTRIWCNPPYSTGIVGRWLARLADHGRGVALIFARTETETFARTVWGCAAALLFIEGRLHFHYGAETRHPRNGRLYAIGDRCPDNAGAPSVLCAYGRRDADVLADCGITGQFVPLRLPRAVAIVAIDQTWAQAVADVIAKASGPVRLDDLYRAFARHPKTRGNKNVAAKIRQTLQRGPFRRVDRGLWEAA